MTEQQTYSQWLRHRACTRKRGRWASQVEANRAALVIWRQGQYVRPYRCHHCGQWHLTSERKEET